MLCTIHSLTKFLSSSIVHGILVPLEVPTSERNMIMCSVSNWNVLYRVIIIVVNGFNVCSNQEITLLFKKTC